MTVRLLLYTHGEGIVLYEGHPSECPPIPRPGDQVCHERKLLRVEKVHHQFWANHVEVWLFAASDIAGPVA